MTKKKPVMLVIMDGFGCSHIEKDNAVAQADLKVLPKLWKEYPHSYLAHRAKTSVCLTARLETLKWAILISVRDVLCTRR